MADLLCTLYRHWWLDIAVSILCRWDIVHIMITHQGHSLETMNLSWLLPVVTLVVGGGNHSTSSYAILTPGCAPYRHLLIDTYYDICSLYISSQPHIQMSKGTHNSIRLLSSRACQAGILRYPADWLRAEGLLRSSITGETIEVICIVTAFALWVFGTTWMVFAFFSLWHSPRRGRIPFCLTFWSMIFPSGVYAIYALASATTSSSMFLRSWGAIYAVGTLLLWIPIAVQTVGMIPSGRIFDAPSLEAGIDRSERQMRNRHDSIMGLRKKFLQFLSDTGAFARADFVRLEQRYSIK
ncbi:hypothetical protein PAXRUDRAFT_254337 [Paxillus rubicundulus Ve08.2h10]|uniref:Uncharacterized protein n=1 Tax=Paxillus rubicundulus Ve08.2h10 TaxID=930991 RepID=A0A0D0E6I1_9AGAM|nr:hypothetical protein PAXRUDRAFT_254337 [Paxillus rubicundulus Ve08.2h10]